jgi:hypothetical protein
MSTTGFDPVNWDVVEKVMNGFPEMFWLWVAKHMSHFCGNGWMQLLCGFWDQSRCPCCQQDNETTTHILFCNGHGANQEWINHVMNLSVWLIEVDTLSLIWWCITESLMEQRPTTSFVLHADHICHTAALEQDEIGWQNFMEVRYLSIGVSCNWIITTKYIQNDLWTVGLLAWCPTYWSWFMGCGLTEMASTTQWTSRVSQFVLRLRFKQLSMMSFARVRKA